MGATKNKNKIVTTKKLKGKIPDRFVNAKRMMELKILRQWNNIH